MNDYDPQPLLFENKKDGTPDLLINVEKQPTHLVEKKDKRRLIVLGLVVAGVIFFNVLASVFRKRLYNAFGTEFSFFRQVLTNLMYDIWATIVVIYKILFTEGIPRSMLRFPIWKFAVLGFFDGFGDFLMSVGGVHTPGAWQVLLNQVLVVFIMLLSIRFLKRTYNIYQYGGVVAIVLGAVVVVIPLLINGQSGAVWYSVLIYTSGNVPSSISYVAKEYFFKTANLDIFYLTTLVSWCQVFLIWLFTPIQSLPGFGGISLKDIPEVFRDGAKCFAGNTNISTGDSLHPYCSSFTTWITFAFSFSGFFAGILQLWMMKHSSSVLMIVATAVSLPLANITFSISFLMGVDVEPFSYWDVGGLVVVVIGFLIYSLKNEEIWSEEATKVPKSTNSFLATETATPGDLNDSQ